jgi:peptidoglycan hydrolase CwlO-like protein
MGFTELYPIPNPPDGMPDYWCEQCQGYLAIRTETNSSKEQWSDQDLEHILGSMVKLEVPELAKSLHGYNIVTYKNKVFGIPQSLGAMDISQTDISSMEGIITGLTVRAVQKEIESLNSVSKSEPLQLEIEPLHLEIEPLHLEIAQLRLEIAQLSLEMEQSKSQIQGMESSKFWKLRSLWLRLKSAIK